MNNQLNLSTLIIIMCLIAACSHQKESDELINIRKISPPVKELDIPLQSYTIQANEYSVIQLENGTRIEIPANTLVDKKGNLVKGDVELTYREMHNAIEVMLSGIPMAYDSGGVSYDFETAGMFEIRASQEGEQLYIAEGSTVNVEMASFNEGSDFNFYSLDEEIGNWHYEGHASPSINKRRQEALKETENALKEIEENIKQVKASTNSQIEEEGAFSLNVNLNQFPEFNVFRSVLWQFAEKSISDNNDTIEEVFSLNWTNIELLKEESHPTYYRLKLEHEEKTFEALVKPVIPGLSDAQQKLLFKEQMSAFEQAKEELKMRDAAARQQAEIIRSFRIAEFGIFNWDIPIKNHLMLAAVFDAGTILEIEQVFLIGHNNRMLIPYSKNMFGNIRVPSDDDFTFLTITPRNEVAIANKKSMEAVRSGLGDGEGQNDFTIKLTPSHRSFSSSEDILSFMEERF